jgi:anti-sigma factor RsiW
MSAHDHGGLSMMTAGEKAMALVDGQLAPAEVPALVQELARNGALVAELQGYLAMSRSRIAQAYAVKPDEPVPRRLIDAVMAMPIQSGAPRPASLATPVAERLIGWLRASCRVPGWSLAAAPALAAAAAFAVAAAILPGGRGGADGLPSADVGAALERTASGKDVALASVRPMLSFNSKDGRWCRQFEVRSAGNRTSHGLACRGRHGEWQLIAATPPTGTGAGYMPAGADRRKMIDDLVTSMIVGEPLSVEGEAAAIGKGWQL